MDDVWAYSYSYRHLKSPSLYRIGNTPNKELNNQSNNTSFRSIFESAHDVDSTFQLGTTIVAYFRNNVCALGQENTNSHLFGQYTFISIDAAIEQMKNTCGDNT